MAMNNSDALEAIAALMRGARWSPETLEAIADIVRAAGYEIADCDDYPNGLRGEE